MKRIVVILSIILIFMSLNLNVFAEEPTKYVIVEVYDLVPTGAIGNRAASVNEIELFDDNGVKINYTVSATDAYDTGASSVPYAWNGTLGSRSMLNDGYAFLPYSATFFSPTGTTEGSGAWARFVLAYNSSSTIAKVKAWTGDNNIPKKITLYGAESYNYNTNIKGRDNTGLTLIAEINPIKTTTSVPNETNINTLTTPTAPNLTAIAGIEKVDLSWDSVENVTGYNVKRAIVAGGPYTTIATNINTTTYTDITAISGTTYYYVVTAVNAQGESSNSNKVAISPLANSESVSVESTVDIVNIGATFTTDIVLHGGTNICAEDFKVTYNTELFEYIGYEAVAGLTVYKEIADSTTGTVRMIVASLGKDNAINGDKALVKLKFKAKKAGKDKIDVVKCRIADNGTFEKDILETNCGEKEITVKANSDVNRTGEFTLLDLAIDAWYYGMPAAETDTTKYDADVVLNGTIDNTDLTAIVAEILNNTNYQPNN